jgi:HPt (histidine-containing phosphotransfer) domain-containing protein
MSTTQKPIFDTLFFNNITGGDEDFKNELIEVFISSSDDQLFEIKKAAEDKNSDQYNWHSVLHSLKGSCSSIGAIQLSELIIKNQNKSNNQISKEERLNIYKEIEQLLQKTKSEMLKIKTN